MPHLKETLTKEARQEISRLTAELNQELLKAVKRLNPDYARERKMRAELGFFSQNLATNLNNLTNLAGPLQPAKPAAPGIDPFRAQELEDYAATPEMEDLYGTIAPPEEK